MLLVAPLTILATLAKEGSWKYGFEYIQPSIQVGLFVGFSISFLLGLYHALSYEMVGQGPLENFLKPHQKVQFKSKLSIDEIAKKLESDERIKDIEQKENQTLTCKRNVALVFPDKISLYPSATPMHWIIESKPFSKWWFIDFGRNFKTVKRLAVLLK